jgi:hypothetical protein
VCEVASPPCPEGCRCVKRPSDRTYTVTCKEVRGLPSHLPDPASPPPFKAKYVLMLSGSHVDTIDYRDYFNNTTSLDVSGSAVANVNDEAWRALVQISDVDLSSNRLTTLSTVLQSENLTFKSLSLHNNPWRCECEDRWIRNWLLSLGNGLNHQDAILCYSPEYLRGRSILSVSDAQFCYDPVREKRYQVVKVSSHLSFLSFGFGD